MKKIIQFLKSPKVWFFALVLIAFAAALAGVFVVLNEAGAETRLGVLAYILYAVSAILLGYVIYCVVYFVPKAKAKIKSVAMRHTFTHKLAEQYDFRTIFFAVFSLAMSIVNAAINGYIGIAETSLWYMSLFAYYVLLATMRGGVIIYRGRKRKRGEGLIAVRENRIYIMCGVMLTLAPIALSGVIFSMYAFGSTFVKAGLLIYVFAGYTFYKITMSIINFVKAKKSDLMTVQAIRNINLADALVSLLALQTAMFHEFSPEANMSTGNTVMGAIICVATVILGIIMVLHGSANIKKETASEIGTDIVETNGEAEKKND